MIVSLLCQPNEEQVAGYAAAVCTNSSDLKKSLRGAIASGHESVLEHINYTFRISGVSRVLLAQLTRHRIASFSVQSQRYVKLDSEENMPVVPKSIKSNGEAYKVYRDAVLRAEEAYWELVDMDIPAEDARYCIPQAVTTTLIMTMNARELRHFFSLRCCNRAQWEIRELADQMLAICRQCSPTIFRDAGPGCLRGKCPEGIRSCGHPREDLA